MAASLVSMKFLGQANHCGRYIYTPAFREIIGQSSGETPDTTPEIEGRSSLIQGNSKPAKMFQDLLDFVLAGRKKFLWIPLLVAFFGVGTDRSQGVRLREAFPVFLQLL